ncbi:MAG: hypothetical protein PHT88_01235 [Candidatus Moranbacteria bacterium]|nr:hypothetical protein [Candidatus Moranbacteria bacterium]
MHKIDILKKSYFVVINVLVITIVLTPYFIRDDVAFFSEEVLEGLIIFLLLAIGVAINYFYEKEMRQQEQMLQEVWKHIGAVNLLVDRFRLALTEDKDYPRSKQEMQEFAASTLGKIRGVVHCDFLLLRVVDTDTFNTVFEYGDTSSQEEGALPKIRNKELMGGQKIGSLEVISSQANAVKLRTFIILPQSKINDDGKMVAQKIINDFTMVYTISSYIL